jgi:uncharacterized protein (TIGR02145 family)
MSGTVAPTQFTVNNIVIIGTQIWTNKNLNTVRYLNGDVIPEVQSTSDWAALTTGAWCYYGNDPANGAIYGKLYNQFAINDSRGLIPIGWHVPTDADLTTLVTYLGGSAVAGGTLKEVGITHWNSPNTGASDSVGFTLLGGGYRGNTGGFASLKTLGLLWSATFQSRWGTSSGITTFTSTPVQQQFGYSIRCIKD